MIQPHEPRLRVPARWALLLAVAAVVLTGGQRASGQAIFRTEVEMVRVDVRVTRSQQPVAGLRASNFELRDEGKVQRIVSFSPDQVPLDVMLVLDASGSISPANAAILRDSAQALLSGLTATDQAGLILFTSRVRLVQPLTSDVARVVERLPASAGDGSTALHDAVYAALRVVPPGDRRRAVVVLTDGVENASWLTADHVRQAARRADAIVHAVVVDMDDRRLRAADAPFLADVAENTGGRVWPVRWGPELRVAFGAVLADLRTRYVLGYYPEGVPAGGWHRLSVTLRGVEGAVTSRTGYTRAAASTRR